MAMTADGKVSGSRRIQGSKDTASLNLLMSEFGSKRDHSRLLRIRASMDAVVCGRLTIESGSVDLGPGSQGHIKLRTKNGLSPFNKRIIVSASGQLDNECRVFQKDFSPIVIATTRIGKKHCENQFKEMPWIHIESFGDTEIDFPLMTQCLRSRWDIRRLVVEGGGMLNDAMFRYHLIDEVFLTICPWVFGGKTNATISDGRGVPELSNAARFKCVERKCIEGEMFLRYLAINP